MMSVCVIVYVHMCDMSVDVIVYVHVCDVCRCDSVCSCV